MNYNSRLQRLESKYSPPKPPYVRAMYEYADDRRLAAVVISGRRVERAPGECKAELAARASAGLRLDAIVWRDIIDARDGRPYPWVDDAR